jgi:ATP-dependent RNA helicase DHX8/PRP22
LEEGPGDILAFLTGQEEIESLERLINERARLLPPESSKIWTTPIYSSLPSEQQMNAFKSAPAGTRKVNNNWRLMALNSLCGILIKKHQSHAFISLFANHGLLNQFFMNNVA